MPLKNVRKIYIKGGHYHVYNRGVEKRTIFEDRQDYKVFLSYLKEILSPPPDKEKLKKTFTLQGEAFKGVPRRPKNYSKKIELLAFCLMPNHFHLLLKQVNSESMKNFIHSISTRYTMYFNKKHNRVGKLYQGPYKAVLIKDDAYLLHLSRYIHLNPSEHTSNLTEAYSSYAEYLRLRNTRWINPNPILKFFEANTIPEIEKFNSYQKFVENYKKDSGKILGDLTLE